MYKEADPARDLLRLELRVDPDVHGVSKIVGVGDFSEFFGIDAFPDVFAGRCREFVEALNEDSQIADIKLREVAMFFEENKEKMKKNKVDLGYFKRVFSDTGLMGAVWDLVNKGSEYDCLMKEVFFFLATLSWMSDEFVDFFLEKDIVAAIADAFTTKRVPEQYPCNEYASMALRNILTRYHMKDATYEHIIPCFSNLCHVLLETYRVERKRVVGIGYLIAVNTTDPLVYPLLIEFFVGNVSSETCCHIATAMAYMLKRRPEILKMSSNVINMLLEMQNQACQSEDIRNASGAVLKAATAALYAAESDAVRDSIARSVPVEIVLAGLSGEAKFFEPALEFVAAIMPSDFTNFLFDEFYNSSDVDFLETVVIRRLDPGNLQEKLGCLKFLDNAVDVFPSCKLALYDNLDLLDSYLEILECGQVALIEHLISLLFKILRDDKRFESSHGSFLREFFAHQEIIQAIHDIIKIAPIGVANSCRKILRIPQILEIPVQELGDVCEAYLAQYDT